MRSCAFLTMEDMTGYVTDDQLAVGPFRELGWHVEWVPWTASADWSRFEAVLIRSTWDYHKHPEQFLSVLERIDAETCLLNPLDVVRWNTRKTYLADLEQRGVEVVPTVFGDGLEPQQIESFFSQVGSERIIIKPVVSGGADLTFLLDPPTADREAIVETFRHRAFMMQPFIESVLEEGEYSVFYFEGEFSHAVVKTPKTLDFRVQEEHGGTIRPVSAPVDLKDAAARAIGAVAPKPLYARADFVRGQHAAWLLMELELIEPSLYLRTHPPAAVRFAAAFDRRMSCK